MGIITKYKFVYLLLVLLFLSSLSFSQTEFGDTLLVLMPDH